MREEKLDFVGNSSHSVWFTGRKERGGKRQIAKKLREFSPLAIRPSVCLSVSLSLHTSFVHENFIERSETVTDHRRVLIANHLVQLTNDTRFYKKERTNLRF